MSISCRRLGIAMVPLVLAVASSGVLAEEQPVLQVGSRVRITLVEPRYGSILEPKRIKGKLSCFTESDITLETSADDPPTVYPWNNVEMLERNIQRGRRNRGALIGLAAGVATGAVVVLVAAASHEDDPNNWEIDILDTEEVVALSAFCFGSVGAIVGALLAPGERWQPIQTDKLQVGIGQGQHGEGRLFCAVRF